MFFMYTGVLVDTPEEARVLLFQNKPCCQTSWFTSSEDLVVVLSCSAK